MKDLKNVSPDDASAKEEEYFKNLKGGLLSRISDGKRARDYASSVDIRHWRIVCTCSSLTYHIHPEKLDCHRSPRRPLLPLRRCYPMAMYNDAGSI